MKKKVLCENEQSKEFEMFLNGFNRYTGLYDFSDKKRQ